ncbi:MAG: type VI secretion system baseplate subunit TssG [Opitutus sp.]
MTAPAELAALLRDPSAYDFFVAMRWLQARMSMPAIGTAVRPQDERVRFAQEPSLGFNPSAISGAEWNEERQRIDLKLCFTGLLGPNGPMPTHLTEYVLDRWNHSKDRTLESFLNIFHHRIYSLFFRAWALNQPTVDFEASDGLRHAHYLNCLVGLGTGGAEGRGSVPDAARLFYSGWLGGLSRTPSGLGAILADYLRVPVEVHCFREMWLELPRDSQCRLGEARATGVIGATCFAGERIQASHLKFRVRIGPLHWREFENLLPRGELFRHVTEWVRSYLGEELFWEVQLVLRSDEAPECRLGGGVRLGWSTWVGRPAPGRDIDDLVTQAA